MAHIENDKSYLLFIEPKERPTGPIIDDYTRKITGAIRNATLGCSTYSHRIPASFHPGGCYRGSHHCECGAMSSNTDYLINTTNKGTVKITGDFRKFSEGSIDTEESEGHAITNSLAIHYVACHREEIPKEMLEQILALPYEPVEPTEKEINYHKPDRKFYDHFENLRNGKNQSITE